MIMTGTLSIIRKYGLVILLIFSLLELLFYPSYENIFGCLSLIYGWNLITAFIFKERYVYKYYIPFTIIFGYAVCFFLIPLPITFIEGKPITFRFSVPYLTFFNQMLHATVIVLAFKVSVRLNISQKLSRLWEKIGFFIVPTPIQIWAMGGIGLVSLIVSLTWQGTDMMEGENLGMIGQLISKLRGFVFLPLGLLFAKYVGLNYKVPRKYIVAYFFIILVVGIATTRRGTIFTGLFAVCMAYFFISIIERRKLFTKKVTLWLIVGVYIITGPAADLSMAMILNRQSVYDTSSSQTFDRILELYSDKEKLHNLYQMAELSNTDNKGDNFSGWSEYYVDNIMLDRFCNLRTLDLTLDYAKHLGFDNKDMHEYFWNHLLFQIPTPILRLLGITVNKFDYLYTPGDLISTNALGLKYQYSGYRVAGDTGIGLYLMGYSYYMFAFIIYIFVFVFLSSLVKLKPIYIIPLPIISGTYFFYFNNGMGIFTSIDLLIRNGWQTVIIYCVFLQIIRILIRK